MRERQLISEEEGVYYTSSLENVATSVSPFTALHPQMAQNVRSPTADEERPQVYGFGSGTPEVLLGEPMFPRELKQYYTDCCRYRTGMSTVAELEDKPGYTGQFIGIRKIIQRHDRGPTGVVVQGPIFERNGQLRGILPLKVNEVSIIEEWAEMTLDKLGRPRTVTMTNSDYPMFCDRIRRAAGQPQMTDKEKEQAKSMLEQTGRLVCRWRVTRAESKQKMDGASVERLRPEEVPEAYRVDDATLQANWRPPFYQPARPRSCRMSVDSTVQNPGVSRPASSPASSSASSVTLGRENSEDLWAVDLTPEPSSSRMTEIRTPAREYSVDVVCTTDTRNAGRLFDDDDDDVIILDAFEDDDLLIIDGYEANGFEIISASMDLTSGKDENRPDSPDPESKLPDGTKYTFGDGFCGGGGMAAGAWAAGLLPTWSFDHDSWSALTYQKNFPTCRVHKEDVAEFIGSERPVMVDVLHLSPPCQPHSPAHTINGKNDEANEAAGLCISDILEKARPRVATLEQTFGILHRARENWFYSMIQAFTSKGWNVRWRVLKCVEYGVPQTRKRLIVVASSPGERLPEWPEPRWRDPNSKLIDIELMRPRTLRDSITTVSRTATHQEEIYFPNGWRRPRSKWDTPLTHTILAGGGEYDVHPDGYRKFTVRELACIQTFPETHDFEGSDAQKRRQIGNAVPPVFAHQILRKVRESLEMEDRRREAEEAERKKLLELQRKRNREEAARLENDAKKRIRIVELGEERAASDLETVVKDPPELVLAGTEVVCESSRRVSLVEVRGHPPLIVLD